MKFSEIFKNEYYNKMKSPAPGNPVRNRADSFLQVFQKLDCIENPLIVETGCMRSDHGDMSFGDDGCSTFIFNKKVEHSGGRVISVDISEINCNHARKFISEKFTTVINSDSVKYLWSIPQDIKIDFLYLDSYDITKDNPHPSQLHHLKELCAVIKNLKVGTVIVVDDHDGFFTNGLIGKGTYVKDFLTNIGAELIFEDYQIGFILK